MSDLVEFLLRQIAEDEAAARAADVGLDLFDGTGVVVMPNASTGDRTVTLPSHVATFVARHDPARVLAECAAKRKIIELHQSWPVLVETPPEFTSDTSDLNAMTFSMSQRMMWLTEQEYRERFGSEPPTAPIIRLLAQPYADADGWDEAWKVET